MKGRFDPARHYRRSIRLNGYNYARTGAYFVTISTFSRAPLFGDIVDGAMCLNDAGHVVRTVWAEIPTHHCGVFVDAFAIVPNHIHGIIVLDSHLATATTAPDNATGAPATHVGAQFIAPGSPTATATTAASAINGIGAPTAIGAVHNPGARAAQAAADTASTGNQGAINRAPTIALPTTLVTPDIGNIVSTDTIVTIAAPATHVGARFIAPGLPTAPVTTTGDTVDPTTAVTGDIMFSVSTVTGGIVTTVTTGTGGGTEAASTGNQGAMNRAPTLGDIVRAFKARATVAVNRRQSAPDSPLWQRNYYEHIIRNDADLQRIRRYIVDNPARWAHDPENNAPAGVPR